MLGKVFQRFIENSPLSVMVRGTIERVLGAEHLDAWYARTAHKQYTRTLLFSTVYDLLSQVVFRLKPSVHAAYRAREDTVGTSIISVYNTLNGVETHTSAELVHGAETVEQEVSSYYIAHEIAETYRGMMIAIPENEWRAFRTMSAAAMGATLLELARKVRLWTLRKAPRGPKKPRPKREANPKQSHVSTAKLLMGRKANVVTP